MLGLSSSIARSLARQKQPRAHIHTRIYIFVGVTAEYPEGSTHHVDAPQKGEMSLKECHVLANHLQSTFGVTNLLPRACSDMLEEAQKMK